MNYTFRWLSVVLIFWGCSQDNSVVFTSEVFTEDMLEICKTDFCSEVTVNYLSIPQESPISASINSKIEDFIVASLFLGEDDKPAASTMEEAATDFILAYRDYQTDLPTELDNGGYIADISTTELFQNNEFVSLEMRQYIFSGGAHGYGTVHFLNIDLETGLELTPEDIFEDYAGFKKYAEEVFRNNNDIAQNESINSTGFWFDDETFYLPETIGFTSESVIAVYNAYDIASYGAGAIELEIPLSEIETFIKSTFL